MRKGARQTGDHGIGELIRVVHMAEDAGALRDFYSRVFGGFVFFGVDEPSYYDVEDRYAALLMVGNLCIETMAPALPPDPQRPVGKFFTKFGTHLHSVGYKVEDLPGLTDRLVGRGIAVSRPGGGRVEKAEPDLLYAVPSPRQTAGLLAELSKHDVPNDPRIRDTWSSLARISRTHPLTIERFSCVTLGVRDLDAAEATYVEALQAVPIRRGVDEDLRLEYALVQLGDSLLELARPLASDSDLGRHVARWGNMIYGLRFRVADLESAAAWLTAQGVRSTRVREGLLVTDPADTFNTPIALTTEDVEGDPFAG